MGAEEIIDWMVYEMTCDPEFKKQLDAIPIAYDDPEEEAAAIKKLFQGLGS